MSNGAELCKECEITKCVCAKCQGVEYRDESKSLKGRIYCELCYNAKIYKPGAAGYHETLEHFNQLRGITQ